MRKTARSMKKPVSSEEKSDWILPFQFANKQSLFLFSDLTTAARRHHLTFHSMNFPRKKNSNIFVCEFLSSFLMMTEEQCNWFRYQPLLHGQKIHFFPLPSDAHTHTYTHIWFTESYHRQLNFIAGNSINFYKCITFLSFIWLW